MINHFDIKPYFVTKDFDHTARLSMLFDVFVVRILPHIRFPMDRPIT